MPPTAAPTDRSPGVIDPPAAAPSMPAWARWEQLADRALAGEPLTKADGLAILRADDDQTLAVLAAAHRVRRRHFGDTVTLYFLMNAKSGLCPEDCHYCSQAKGAKTDIPRYNLLSPEKILDGARIAAERGSRTYCIVISGRGANEREIAAMERLVPLVKEQYDLKVCACLGLLSREQAGRLAACGVDRVNHNLNTSEQHYGDICTTHTYQDRLDTLRAVRAAGIELCSGGILGMGETDEDIVDLACALRDLACESIPINFLNPIEGTKFSGRWELTPNRCLRALAMFRLLCPTSELRIAGGREIHLRSLQPLGLYAANSVFVGDYLTTKGQDPDADTRMIEDLGFTVTREAAVEIDESEHMATP